MTSGRRWSRAARIAATLGGLLFFFAAWIPWASALTSGDLRQGGSGPRYLYAITPAELGAPPLASALGSSTAFAAWGLLTALGVLFTPLLWQRVRPWLVWVGAILYLLWGALAAIVLLETCLILFQTIPAQTHADGGPYTTTVQPSGAQLAFYAATPAAGAYLSALALLIALAALVLAVVGLLTNPPSFRQNPVTIHGEVATATHGSISSVSPSSAVSARRALPGAGAVTGGMLLWLWGFFLLPWATLNCVQTPLLAGHCEGLPGFATFPLGLYSLSAVVDPNIALWAANGLMLIGAALALAGVWTREITRTVCAWLTGWLIFTLASSLVALHGVQVSVSNPTSVGLAAGTWRGSLGTLIVFLGLLLVIIGIAPLWALAVRSAPRRDPATP
jgi:hypothetical protein